MRSNNYNSSNAYNHEYVRHNRLRVSGTPRVLDDYRKATPSPSGKTVGKWNMALIRRKRKEKLKTIMGSLLIFALALFMLYRYVMISETGSQINELKKQYTDIQAQNQELQKLINNSVNLTDIEKIAHERLGMVKPERYQIFYVDMKMDDVSENISKEKEEKNRMAASASGTIINAVDMLK